MEIGMFRMIHGIHIDITFSKRDFNINFKLCLKVNIKNKCLVNIYRLKFYNAIYT